MLAAIAFFFFGLAMVTKVKIWPSVTNIIITCGPKMAVATEVPSVATCFSLSIFASHLTPPLILSIALGFKKSIL